MWRTEIASRPRLERPRIKEAVVRFKGYQNKKLVGESVAEIEQLKNGVNAMRMPVDDLLSNWACMVMTALAWNLEAWFGLLLPNRQRGDEIVRMEFRRFLHLLILLPTQIVRAGRRIIFRLLAYNDCVAPRSRIPIRSLVAP